MLTDPIWFFFFDTPVIWVAAGAGAPRTWDAQSGGDHRRELPASQRRQRQPVRVQRAVPVVVASSVTTARYVSEPTQVDPIAQRQRDEDELLILGLFS